MALTDKQKRFCEEYLIDLNATQAAIRSGYSEKTAHSIGAENLIKPEIQTYISELQKSKSDELNINQNMVLKELMKVAFGDVKNYFDERGRLIDINELENEVSGSIKSVTVQQEKLISDGRTTIESSIKKIESYDKLKALEIINKMLGFYVAEKHQHQHEGKFDITKLYNADKGEVETPGE